MDSTTRDSSFSSRPESVESPTSVGNNGAIVAENSCPVNTATNRTATAPSSSSQQVSSFHSNTGILSRGSSQNSVIGSQGGPHVKYNLASESDWYGNNPLHHVYALNVIDLNTVQKILNEFPLSASGTNQFGRLPLHYALDRSRIDIEGLKVLLDAFPMGAGLADNKGVTPFDVAENWKHSNQVLSLLVKADPKCCDWATYSRLKYPYCSCLFRFAHLLCQRRVHVGTGTGHDRGEFDDDREDHDNSADAGDDNNIVMAFSRDGTNASLFSTDDGPYNYSDANASEDSDDKRSGDGGGANRFLRVASHKSTVSGSGILRKTNSTIFTETALDSTEL